jgi:hypothetical protein
MIEKRCYECDRLFTKPQEYRKEFWYGEKGGPVYRYICRSEWHGMLLGC